MARFYADEDFPYPVVEALRRRGHDVLTCEAAGRANRGIRDEDVLADAAQMGRIVLTKNRDDSKGFTGRAGSTAGWCSAGTTPTPTTTPVRSRP